MKDWPCYNCEGRVYREWNADLDEWEVVHSEGNCADPSVNYYLCIDCGVDTCHWHPNGINEYYVVQDDVWPIPKDGGMLCISCIEQRIGRELTAVDFKDCPANAGGFFQQSDRLKSRLANQGEVKC